MTGQRTDRDDLNLTEAFEMARESIKALLALNGGAAVAILAFYGQAVAALGALSTAARWALANGLKLFAIGTIAATVTLFLAYLVQLNWGAAYPSEEAQARAHRRAGSLHLLAFLTAFASLALFVLGLLCVAWAIQEQPVARTAVSATEPKSACAAPSPIPSPLPSVDAKKSLSARPLSSPHMGVATSPQASTQAQPRDTGSKGCDPRK